VREDEEEEEEEERRRRRSRRRKRRRHLYTSLPTDRRGLIRTGRRDRNHVLCVGRG
jgi:hypothetical protein